MRAVTTLLVVFGAAGCSHVDDPPPPTASGCTEPVTLKFLPDVAGDSGEAYTCYSFDAQPFAGRYIRGLAWEIASDGPVIVHHAGIYASPDPPRPDPIQNCVGMPNEDMTMHVWGPGSSPMSLPDDVAIVLPPGTRSLVVQSHAMRFTTGLGREASVQICATDTPPEHAAMWLRAGAAVPTIAPHSQQSSTGTCLAGAELHLLTTRPHMHRAGKEFRSGILRASGEREPFVDVFPWDAEQQKTYPLDLVLEAGDGVESTCVWENSGDTPIVNGVLSSNEMCHQGMVVWPTDAAYWTACH